MLQKKQSSILFYHGIIYRNEPNKTYNIAYIITVVVFFKIKSTINSDDWKTSQILNIICESFLSIIYYLLNYI